MGGLRPVADFDPPTHPLLDVSAALESSTDAFMGFINEEAVAEVAYKRAFSVAYAHASGRGTAATARKTEAETDPLVVDADVAREFARARRVAAKAHSDAIGLQAMLHMAYYKLVGTQDGGIR